MATPITMSLVNLQCVIETDEVGADEPYVLVTSINLKSLVPQVEVTRYGPWANIDAGDVASTIVIPPGFDPDVAPFLVWRRPAWGVSGSPTPIENPDDAIFLVSLMEHDDGDAAAARTIVKGAAAATLASSMGMTRAERVTKLISDINGALAIPTGAPNFDDRVGSTQELRLSSTLLQVDSGPKSKTMTFSGDGGQYRARFDFAKAA
jgi:hypothetical protein